MSRIGGSRAWAFAACAVLLAIAVPLGVVLADDAKDREKDVRSHRWVVLSAGVHLGVHLQSLSDGLRNYFRVPEDQGVLISEVIKGSPAEKAGLRPGDVILRVDDERVSSHGDVVEALEDLKAGDHVTLRIIRDRVEMPVEAVLEERPRHESTVILGPRDLDITIEPFLDESARHDIQREMERAHEEVRKALKEKDRIISEEVRREMADALREAREAIREGLREALEEVRESIREIREETDKRPD